MEPPLGTISFFLLCMQARTERAAACWRSLVPPTSGLASVRSHGLTLRRNTRLLQFGREASNNLGAMTPHMRHKMQMADKLVAAFPQYTKDVVADYAMGELFSVCVRASRRVGQGRWPCRSAWRGGAASLCVLRHACCPPPCPLGRSWPVALQGIVNLASRLPACSDRLRR